MYIHVYTHPQAKINVVGGKKEPQLAHSHRKYLISVTIMRVHGGSCIWVYRAWIKELNLRYNIGETTLITIYTHPSLQLPQP